MMYERNTYTVGITPSMFTTLDANKLFSGPMVVNHYGEDIPIAPASIYKHLGEYERTKGNCDYVAMRGSKCSIHNRNLGAFGLPRAREYEYTFARYFGRWCARKLGAKSGVLKISCRQMPVFAFGSFVQYCKRSQGGCAFREFESGYTSQSEDMNMDNRYHYELICIHANNVLMVAEMSEMSEDQRAAVEALAQLIESQPSYDVS